MSNGRDFDPDIEKFKQEFKKNIKYLYLAVGAILLIGFFTSSFYTIEPDEEAVVIRLGKYIGTYPPGPHLKLPFGIDKLIKVQTTRVLQEEFGFRTHSTRERRTSYAEDNFDNESLMLTGDLNVADVEWVVHYKISDPFKFIFQTSEPITNVRDVSESIMRRVVGDRAVSEVLTTGRKDVSIQARELIQEVLDRYDLGISIQTVKLQDVNPPEKVRPSFNEVNEAKQEQEKVINQAEKAYNDVIPEARGKAEKSISEAEAFAAALINTATGDAAKFLAIAKEYKVAPEVTRRRLYIETMEELFSRMENIVIVDEKVKGVLPIFNDASLVRAEK